MDTISLELNPYLVELGVHEKRKNEMIDERRIDKQYESMQNIINWFQRISDFTSAAVYPVLRESFIPMDGWGVAEKEEWWQKYQTELANVREMACIFIDTCRADEIGHQFRDELRSMNGKIRRLVPNTQVLLDFKTSIADLVSKFRHCLLVYR